MTTLFHKECTASYIKADSNFKIFNLRNEESQNKYYSVICLLLNLLQRGNPTDLSSYLKTRYEYKDSARFLHLFSQESPNWGELIRGNDYDEQYPARKFYDSILLEYFTEYPYLQQLLMPEVKISDIVPSARKTFAGQQVDFFLPYAKLVIEIDGGQHKDDEQKSLDCQRNVFLEENGYQTVRIPTTDMNNPKALSPYVTEIKNRIKEFELVFKEFNESYRKCKGKKINKELEMIATMRLQVTLLHMCLCGMISLEDREWHIFIKNHEVTGYEHAALEDMFLWIENICCMAGIPFQRPFVVIEQAEKMERVRATHIRIEMSVLKRGTPCNTEGNWVYIYNDWRQDMDYFKMHIGNRLRYDIYQAEPKDGSDEEQSEQYNAKRRALRFMLKNIFGFDEFRQGQERIIINALKGRDTIGVLPTGSGKSLCYQMAVLLQPCVSFCVCPIKSLMVDQDMNLKARGINRTAFLSSDLSGEERERVQEDFKNGKYWFVFVSPERFQSTTFRKYLTNMSTIGRIKFAYAVLDEVHCVSEWGHDFRVSYLNLTKTIRRYCSGITMFGLTATASYNVLKNILIEFHMKDKRDVISTPTFTRPELHFNVERIDLEVAREQQKKPLVKGQGKNKVQYLIEKVRQTSKYEALIRILSFYRKMYPNIMEGIGKQSRCGIIFFPYVNGAYGCFGVSQTLVQDFQADVRFYSGEAPCDFDVEGIPFDVYKKNVQTEFKDNVFTQLCATKAFGMGIDKPNIRYTVHYGIPSSLESLYQEAGRAGRDRKKATCTILYTPESADVRKKIDRALGIGASIEDLKKVAKDYGKKGQDAIRQMFLMANGMSPFEEEEDEVKAILQKYAKPKASNVRIQADKGVNNDLQEKQKYLYHLSLIGVVEDWTVDWKSSSLGVDFCNYTPDVVFQCTEKYIRNYETDYQLKEDPNFKELLNGITEKGEELAENNNYILLALTVFWKWYYNNIVYSRKQALKNVIEACDSFTKETAEDFKEKMEAYFRLGDITDKLGVVADEPQEYRHWFKILNVDTIKKEKVGNILMGLNRFLESYQNNVGLNYISGLLNMINEHFEGTDSKDRLLRSLGTISTFKESDRVFIIQESARVMYELSSEETQEEFAEFFVNNFPLEDAERHIYKVQGDNYSLKFYIEKILANMIKEIEDTDYGKR